MTILFDELLFLSHSMISIDSRPANTWQLLYALPIRYTLIDNYVFFYSSFHYKRHLSYSVTYYILLFVSSFSLRYILIISTAPHEICITFDLGMVMSLNIVVLSDAIPLVPAINLPRGIWDNRPHQSTVERGRCVYIPAIAECIIQCSHKERNGVSNHRHLDLYSTVCSGADQRKHQSTACLCKGNSPVTGEFPAQRVNNAENVSIWWRHPGHTILDYVSLWRLRVAVYFTSEHRRERDICFDVFQDNLTCCNQNGLYHVTPSSVSEMGIPITIIRIIWTKLRNGISYIHYWITNDVIRIAVLGISPYTCPYLINRLDFQSI